MVDTGGAKNRKQRNGNKQESCIKNVENTEMRDREWQRGEAKDRETKKQK